MDRTRQLRYGGLAFVFIGFFVFAVVFFVLVQVGGRSSDGTVVLVATAGLCWLIVARLLWAHAIAPRLYSRIRSEEHTSELQSHLNLVCRLLLEKKKHYM